MSTSTQAAAAALPISSSSDLDTDRLYRRYHKTVTRWAQRLTHSLSDAEDIAQEVFLVVERRRGDFADMDLHSPASWLYRITTNIVRHRWRDQQRHGSAGAEPLTDLQDQTPSPLDDLVRRRRLELVTRAFASLTETQQQLLLMWDVRRLATSDISAITGVKAETLRVRRFRARNQIAQRLRELERTDVPRTPTYSHDDFRPIPPANGNYNESPSGD